MSSPRNSQQKISRTTNPCENACSTIVSELLADVDGLDQELIVEILARLPVKSLSKFKCVSKSWLSLIPSPKFISSHFFTSNSRADQLHHVNSEVLFSSSGTNHGVKRFTLYSALFEPSANVSDIEIPSHKPGEYLIIFGIINGLVCVLGDDGVFFWNPVLSKSKRLSDPDPSISRTGNENVAYGFGYVDSNDDYKVVLGGTFSDSDAQKVNIYSRLTDSWRRIEECKPGLPFHGHGKYANGKIHWTCGSSPHEWNIVTLDMASENYGELQRPDYDVGVSSWVLGLSREQLVLLYDYDDHERTDVWVMDKYGVHESWSKVVSIPYHPEISYQPHVVCILRNGLVVLSAGSDLLVYHSEHKEFRNIQSLGGSEILDFHVYVESLVSPNGSGL